MRQNHAGTVEAQPPTPQLEPFFNPRGVAVILEEMLVEYEGTVLIVSHDREFLNNVVTRTIVFEGDGTVTEYVGGYDDWLLKRSSALLTRTAQTAKQGKRR